MNLKCLNCLKESCRMACPSKVHIKEVVNLYNNDKTLEALKLHSKDNYIGFITGELCNKSKFCLNGCNNKKNPVEMPNLCKLLGEMRIDNLVLKETNKSSGKIAVIGGGIASLIASEILITHNYEVTIFEKTNKLGGVLVEQIPTFRYDLTYLNKWIDKLIKAGLNVCYNKTFGKDLLIEDLKDYDDIIIGMGTSLDREVVKVKGFISASKVLKQLKNNTCKIKNKKVIVLGCGNTAIDTARALQKAGNTVEVCYRRTLDVAPCSKEELQQAIDEGIKFNCTVRPDHITLGSFNKAISITSNTPSLEEGLTTFSADYFVTAYGTKSDMSYIKKIKKNLLDKDGYPMNIINSHFYFIGDYLTGASSFSNVNKSTIDVINNYILNKSNVKTVLFGGTFNPVTIAHEEIIDYLAKNYQEVIILPNGDSYKFEDKVGTNFKHRFKMLKLVTKKYPNVIVSDYEQKNTFNGVVNTLEHFNHPLYVIGDDCLDHFDKWIDYERLLKDNEFILFNRGIYKDLEAKILSLPFLRDYIDKFHIVNIGLSDVSSTDYRTNFNQEIVSKKVLKYIEKNNLYNKNLY